MAGFKLQWGKLCVLDFIQSKHKHFVLVCHIKPSYL